MGIKDTYQYDYLDDSDWFADQVNGALFQGREVVKSEELEPADALSVYLGKEAGARKNYIDIADKARTWRGEADPNHHDTEPDLCGLPHGA